MRTSMIFQNLVPRRWNKRRNRSTKLRLNWLMNNTNRNLYTKVISRRNCNSISTTISPPWDPTSQPRRQRPNRPKKPKRPNRPKKPNSKSHLRKWRKTERNPGGPKSKARRTRHPKKGSYRDRSEERRRGTKRRCICREASSDNTVHDNSGWLVFTGLIVLLKIIVKADGQPMWMWYNPSNFNLWSLARTFLRCLWLQVWCRCLSPSRRTWSRISLHRQSSLKGSIEPHNLEVKWAEEVV